MAIELRGVPHTAAGHHTVYDWAVVLGCPACAHGDLRSFSHDCWHPPWEEEWDMEWSTQLLPPVLTLLRSGLAGCPAPDDPACSCAVHVSLRETYHKAGNVRLDRVPAKERGTARPDAHVALRDDNVPEFTYPPKE